ncbi:hypothetical protein ACQKMD_21845, partial [Viridibacillus sp. NPDC096237]|uniref:hypothetical protein n=1 Tax=Viridibacillus sp. NPDC096237 TaxID=3390721 RepID=UPI003D02B0D7
SSFTGHSRFSFLLSIILLALNFTVQLSVDYSPAQYETVEGIIQGEMELKRQFITRDGQIKTMFDTGVTIGNHYGSDSINRLYF